LGEGLDSAGRVGVNSWGILVITVAHSELALGVSSGSHHVAANAIENVVAVLGRVCYCRVTGLEAEDGRAHVVVPFDDLLVAVVVAAVAGESVGVYETTKWVTTEISSVGVQLASTIIGLHANIGLVDGADNLDVPRCLQDLNTSEGSGGHDTGAMPSFCAPGDGLTLGVGDSGVGSWRRPKTEIIDRVQEAGLAKGGLGFGGAVANVVAGLWAAVNGDRIDLVWNLAGVCVMVVDKGSDGGLGGDGGDDGEES